MLVPAIEPQSEWLVRAKQIIDATQQQLQIEDNRALHTSGEDVKPQLLGQQGQTQIAVAHPAEPTFIGDALQELRQALTEFRARAEKQQAVERQKEELVLRLCTQLLEPKTFLPQSELNEEETCRDSYAFLSDSNVLLQHSEANVQIAETSSNLLHDTLAEGAPVAHVEEDEPMAQESEDAPVVKPGSPASPHIGELSSGDGKPAVLDVFSDTDTDDDCMSILTPTRRVHCQNRNSCRRASLVVDDPAKAHELLSAFERRRDADREVKLVEKAVPVHLASFLGEDMQEKHEHGQVNSSQPGPLLSMGGEIGQHEDSDSKLPFRAKKTMGFSKLSRLMGLRGTTHAGDDGAQGDHAEVHVWYCPKCTNANNMNRFKCTDCGTQREKLVDKYFIEQAPATLSDWDSHQPCEPAANNISHPCSAPAKHARGCRHQMVPIRKNVSAPEVDETKEVPMPFKAYRSEGLSKPPNGDATFDKRKTMGFSKLAKFIEWNGSVKQLKQARVDHGSCVIKHVDHHFHSHGGHVKAHVWHCPKCTNENNMFHSRCTDCGAQREAIAEKTTVACDNDTHVWEHASPLLDGSPAHSNVCDFLIPVRRVPSARQKSGRRPQLFVDSPEKARNLLLTLRRGRREAVAHADFPEMQPNDKAVLPDVENQEQRHAATFHSSPNPVSMAGALTLSASSPRSRTSQPEVERAKTLGFRTIAKIMGLRHHAAVKFAADQHEGCDV